MLRTPTMSSARGAAEDMLAARLVCACVAHRRQQK